MIRLAQITDTHLMPSPEQGLYGINTERTLGAVLQRVRDWAPDRVLLTGDLSDTGDPDSYRRLARHVRALGIPSHAIPGNHDDAAQLRRSLDNSDIDLRSRIDLDGWTVLMLDSSISGRCEGRLDPDQLEALARDLDETRNRHRLIALHHHPVPVGSPWLDVQALMNAEEFWQIVEPHDVELVVCGHVHQSLCHQRGATTVFCTPSTCSQARPHSERFIDDTVGPGFRWLELHPDGHWDSGLIRLPTSGLELAPA